MIRCKGSIQRGNKRKPVGQMVKAKMNLRAGQTFEQKRQSYLGENTVKNFFLRFFASSCISSHFDVVVSQQISRCAHPTLQKKTLVFR